jgi:hypothetical protein
VFVRRASVFAMRNHARALVVEVAASRRAHPGVGRAPGVLPHPPGLAHHARILPSMGSVCIELNRYINVSYSILVIIVSGAYNERMNETLL